MTARSTFALRLGLLRRRRGLSQLQLALAAACSQRHLSFLELGRAKPSREMVLRLSTALGITLRQSNELLLGAGYAPAWAETDLGAEELAPIRAALDYMLAQQEPYPAVVVDRRWNLLKANRGAGRMVEALVGQLPPGAGMNLADALVAPGVLRPHLLNWPEVVAYFVRSVEADAAADGTPETAALLDRLLGYPDVRTTLESAPPQGPDAPVVALRLEKGRTRLHLFTTIATLGTPQDITLQELRIESFFPMDSETRDTFRTWAAQAAPLVAPATA
jgi:transcriptional regulator with XRE-family HTH domain